MIRFHGPTVSLCSSLFLTGAALASGGAAPSEVPGALRVEVTPQGAFYREVAGLAATGGSQSLSTGLVWTHGSGALAWIGADVSVGNGNSQVFTQYTLNNERNALFSTSDSNPPTPLWEDASPLGAEFPEVASAETADVHVAIHRVGTSGPAVLNKYSTASAGTPDWTFNFAPAVAQNAKVGISRDGQTIVAAIVDPFDATADKIEIGVFGPASNVPVSYTVIAVANNQGMRGFDLSADGSTLYFSSGVTANVWDVATQTVVFSTNIGASFDSHAISGDGSVFAFGNFNLMRVFQLQGGTYVNTFNKNFAGQVYVAQIDISDDSSTIAYGLYYYNPGVQIQVEACDVTTQATTMSEIVTGTGTLQNLLSAVSISADGSRFAVGTWGDAGGVCHEIRYYSRNQNAPLATLDLPGSVFGIAISADGQWVAAGSKAVHANNFGNGGRIDLLGKVGGFPELCAGDGSNGPCPCGNTGAPGNGCDNSAATGGAHLSGSGTTAPDTVVLTSTGELPTVLTIALQGDALVAVPVVFGDGLRCAAGNLKRLYSQNAVGGSVTVPGPGDPSVSAQSAALGDPIAPGTTRWYQFYYRDPVLGFCPSPPGNSWNVTNAVAITW